MESTVVEGRFSNNAENKKGNGVTIHMLQTPSCAWSAQTLSVFQASPVSLSLFTQVTEAFISRLPVQFPASAKIDTATRPPGFSNLAEFSFSFPNY